MTTDNDQEAKPSRASVLKRVPIGKLVLELFLIVVAVLLALAVDKWREARAEDLRVRSVLRTVRAELERNKQILDARLAYHAAVAKTIEAAGDTFFAEEKGSYRLRSKDKIPWRRDIGLREGTGLGLTPGLADIAWQAALGSGALNSVDYRLFYQLAVAYTAVGGVRQAEHQVLQDLEEFDRAFLERQAPLAAFNDLQGSFGDLVLGEQELHAEIERVLGLLRPASAAGASSGQR